MVPGYRRSDGQPRKKKAEQVRHNASARKTAREKVKRDKQEAKRRRRQGGS